MSEPSVSAKLGGTAKPAGRVRLIWPDTIKGIAILWIVFFHGFKEFSPYPWPLHPDYWQKMCGDVSLGLATFACAGRASLVAVSSVGFHCVGVFLLLSGFTLGLSVARRVGPVAWVAWYRGRLARLFPLYWTAHILYLLSPSVFHLEAIDYRFLLSFLGDRVFPLDVFLYANAAWWYFGLLLQLYLVFPALWRVFRYLGGLGFLGMTALLTAFTRYLLLFPLASEHSESLLLGAVFPSRLFEFAVGIVLADAYVRSPEVFARRLFHPLAVCLGAVSYTAGVYSYGYPLAYVATDGLIACGLSLLLANLARAMELFPRLCRPLTRVGEYSYGLYLMHQPYMIWLGRGLVGMPLGVFVMAGLLLTGILAVVCIAIEQRVNSAAARWLG